MLILMLFLVFCPHGSFIHLGEKSKQMVGVACIVIDRCMKLQDSREKEWFFRLAVNGLGAVVLLGCSARERTPFQHTNPLFFSIQMSLSSQVWWFPYALWSMEY